MATDGLRVACIGECMLELRQGDGGGTVLTHGGDTLNTAVYLARCGAGHGLTVDYVTALGDDPYSDEMLAAWRAEGIGTDLVERLPGGLPGLYAIRTDAAGERSFHYWRGAAAARQLMRTPLGDALEQRLARHALVYLSGISLSILRTADRRRLLAALRQLRRGGVRIAVDSNYRPRGWSGPDAAGRWLRALHRCCDIALPTFDDEAAVFGDRDPAATAARLRRLGVAEIVVKNGSAPATLALPGGDVSVPATGGATVVDTTAAGDAFNAAYLAARLRGLAPAEAAGAGHWLAGAVIGHRGAVIPAAAMPRT